MKKMMLVAAALMMAACGGGQADKFRTGVPTTDAVKLNVPARAGQGLQVENLGTSQQALQGEDSDFYKLTRGVTLGINGGTAAVLGLVKAITDRPPTSVNGNVATWGPHTEALSPTTWKLTVTKVADDEFSYIFEGKAKQDDDTKYRKVLTGTHKPTLDAAGDPVEKMGSGDFVLNWDERKQLPEPDGNVGKAHIFYSRASATADVTIKVQFTQVKDEQDPSKLIDAEYRYLETTAKNGEFQFATNKDLDKGNASRPLVERLTVRSRWTAQGAGRADVKATGGDIATEATASECWDTNFLSQYMTASWAPAEPSVNYGSEAAGCTDHPAASYSTL